MVRQKLGISYDLEGNRPDRIGPGIRKIWKVNSRYDRASEMSGRQIIDTTGHPKGLEGKQ